MKKLSKTEWEWEMYKWRGGLASHPGPKPVEEKPPCASTCKCRPCSLRRSEEEAK